MSTHWIDWLGLFILAVLLQAAVLVFIWVQAQLNDPRHAQHNEEWFAIFERHQAERYADKSLRWRVEGLGRHFHRYDGLR
jgi:hypothetical protein